MQVDRLVARNGRQLKFCGKYVGINKSTSGKLRKDALRMKRKKLGQNTRVAKF